MGTISKCQDCAAAAAILTDPSVVPSVEVCGLRRRFKLESDSLLKKCTGSWFQDAIWDVEILGDSHVHIESYWYLMILRRFAILLGSRFGAILNIEASISMQLTLFAQLLLILVLVWSLTIAYKCNFGNSVVEHLPLATIFWDLEKKWKNTTSEQIAFNFRPAFAALLVTWRNQCLVT